MTENTGYDPQEVRARHTVRTIHISGHDSKQGCNCGNPWPCDAIVLLDALLAAEARADRAEAEAETWKGMHERLERAYLDALEVVGNLQERADRAEAERERLNGTYETCHADYMHAARAIERLEAEVARLRAGLEQIDREIGTINYREGLSVEDLTSLHAAIRTLLMVPEEES